MFHMSDSILSLFRMMKFTKNKTSESHSRVTRIQKGEKEYELVVIPPKKFKKAKALRTNCRNTHLTYLRKQN